MKNREENLKKKRKRKKKKENFIILSAFFLAAIVFLGAKYTLNILNERKNTNIASQKNTAEHNKNKNDNNKNDKQENNNNNNNNNNNSINNPLDLVEKSNHVKSAAKYAYDTAEIRDYILSNKPYSGNKKVFLTFDDGVTPGITDKVLDILKEKQVPATFFIVGKTLNDAAKPYLERELKEGHAIAVHSFTHDYDILYPGRVPNVDAIKTEAEKTHNRLVELLGENFKSNVWRYPGGHLSWKGLDSAGNADEVLKGMGFEWIDWNSLSGDAEPLKKRPTNEQEMMEFVKTSLTYWKQQDVVVLLMHDSQGKELTVNTLPMIIDHFKSEGFEFGILK